MLSGRKHVSFGICLIMYAAEVTSLKCGGNDYGDSCLRCGDAGCVKCARLIVLGTRACVQHCPNGFREEWSGHVDYMGRVCRESSRFGAGREAAVGACGGAGACVALLALFTLLVALRRRRLRRHQLQLQMGFTTDTQRPSHVTVCSSERQVFLKHLSLLRCEAPIFLSMLNDTRRQLRELQLHGNCNDSAFQVYRPVLRDLARLLLLLNRSENKIVSPPANWGALFAWSETMLNRYKKQHPHQVAEAQLADFLRVPIQANVQSSRGPEDYGTRRRGELTTFQAFNSDSSSTLMSNFKGATMSHSTLRASNESLQEFAISFNSNYNTNRDPLEYTFQAGNEDIFRKNTSKFQPSLLDTSNDFNSCWEFIPADYSTLAEWSSGRDYTINDDDFFSLGYRPQDEITTEL